MARPPRPLEPEEKDRDCDRCGAQAGERCVNPDGSTYPAGSHAARKDGYKPPVPPDPDRKYKVTGCLNCQHPGGLHVIDQWDPRVSHCRCCADCPGWADGPVIWWSDQMTSETIREPFSDG